MDQALVVKNGFIRRRTVKTGYRTLDFTEALAGVSQGDHVVVADQDRLRNGQPVRQRMVGTGRKAGK